MPFDASLICPCLPAGEALDCGGMTGLAIVAVLWITGLIAYFGLTTERQRENYLLTAWIAMLAPAIVFLLIVLTR